MDLLFRSDIVKLMLKAHSYHFKTTSMGSFQALILEYIFKSLAIWTQLNKKVLLDLLWNRHLKSK